MSRANEELIRQAMQEGKFDNLPGKGRPLPLDENPHEDPELRMAHHVLRQSGFTLPWIETRREIESTLDEARTTLRRSWSWRQTALSENGPSSFVDAEWNRALNAFQRQVTSLNQRISDYNLEVPTAQLQRSMIDFERELQKITA